MLLLLLPCVCVCVCVQLHAPVAPFKVRSKKAFRVLWANGKAVTGAISHSFIAVLCYTVASRLPPRLQSRPFVSD